ncbi:MAG: hypothetical protein PHT79_10565 [Syntrophomonadaceae bacterium]|nr:hypothetical protein [Syntrophomonadaceae bacterium]MDD4550186.1 hypothetical protein [Syntrophomonadaceae bacterium]
MRCNQRNSWLNLIFVILFLIIYFIISGFIRKNYSVNFNYLPNIIWMNIWPLLLGGYFAKGNLKSWCKPGKMRIDFGYLIIAILCFFINFFTFSLFGFSINFLSPALGILFGHSIINSFYKTSCTEEKTL